MKDLKLDLIVRAIDRATAPLRRVSDGLAALEKRTEKLHKAFHKLGMAELIGGAFFTGTLVEGGHLLFELTERTAEFGVQALHASQKAAMTVEQIQKLQFAAKMLDVDADSLGETMFRFNQHVVAAATGSKREERALRAMGVQIKDSHGKLKPLYDLFLQFSDAFSKMDARKANYAAFTMLGRGGVQSIPLLKAGAEALKAYGEQAERMGVIMDDETAKKSEEFVQRMKLVGVAVDGLKLRLGIKLMPAMDAVLVKLKEMIEKLTPDALNRFSNGLGKLIDQFPKLLPKIFRTIELATRLADRLLELSDHAGIVKAVLIGLAGILGVQLLIALVQVGVAVAQGAVALVGFIGFLGDLIAIAPAATSAMELLDFAMDANPIGVVILIIGALIAVVGALAFAVYEIYAHWSGIVAWWKGIWAKFGPEIAAAFPWITAMALAVYEIYKHWGGITGWFKDLWKSVENAFSDAWKRITDMTPDWLKTLLKIGALGLSVTGMPGMIAYAAPTPAPAQRPAVALPPRAGPGQAGGQGHSRQKIDLHLHVDSDGKVKVIGASASGPGVSVHVNRGRIIA